MVCCPMSIWGRRSRLFRSESVQIAVDTLWSKLMVQEPLEIR